MDGTNTPPVNLAGDLLRGAKAIAEFWHGEVTKADIRNIYHLAETSNIPIFRMGSVLCARRSTLIKWIEEQEKRGWCFKNGSRSAVKPKQPRSGSSIVEPEQSVEGSDRAQHPIEES